MKFSIAIAAVAGLAAAAPQPTRTEEKRAASFCDQWGSVQTGVYTVYNNLWGQSSGTGSQCTSVQGLSGNTLSWSTSWSWSGGPYSVKSYANAVLKFTPARLSAISSIPSVWKWSYKGTNIDGDVAYDLFTSNDCSTNQAYEIMIWLAALGPAGPISASGSPIATPSVAGVTWKLYSGMNGNTKVFSFVAPSQQTNFSGDLNAFLKYLTSKQGMPTSQCLYSVGAGTEPFTGSNAVLTTTAYSAQVNAK